MTTIALATCEQFPDLDDDDRLLLPELARRGIAGVPAVWTDPSIDWSGFDAVVIRETWDYAPRREEFLGWAREVARSTALHNAAETIEWNTDKRYLRDLAAAGIPVVPTQFVEPGEDPAAVPLPGSGDVVVKPAVSAGSQDTVRYAAAESASAARAHLAALLAAGRTVMVQPYLDAVDTLGETALLFMSGRFSHAIRKGPLLQRDGGGERVAGLFLAEQIDPREPSDAERALADAVVAAIPGPVPLYARVDLLPDPEGRPRLLELELTEPSLFLAHEAGAAGRLADAIADRLADRPAR